MDAEKEFGLRLDSLFRYFACLKRRHFCKMGAMTLLFHDDSWNSSKTPSSVVLPPRSGRRRAIWWRSSRQGGHAVEAVVAAVYSAFTRSVQGNKLQKGREGVASATLVLNSTWTCDCASGYWCFKGCAAPHPDHRCIVSSLSPTKFPTLFPTPYPTPAHRLPHPLS